MIRILRELYRWIKYYRHDEYVNVKSNWITR